MCADKKEGRGVTIFGRNHGHGLLEQNTWGVSSLQTETRVIRHTSLLTIRIDFLDSYVRSAFTAADLIPAFPRVFIGFISQALVPTSLCILQDMNTSTTQAPKKCAAQEMCGCLLDLTHLVTLVIQSLDSDIVTRPRPLSTAIVLLTAFLLPRRYESCPSKVA